MSSGVRGSGFQCLSVLVCTSILTNAFVAIGHAQVSDDAAQLFNAFYAADVSFVTSTPSPDDDVELAKAFLKTAKSSDTDKGVIALLCDHAYELAAKDRSGYNTAIDALRYIAKRYPDRRALSAQRLIPLYDTLFREAAGESRKRYAHLLVEQIIIRGEAALFAGDTEVALRYFKQGLPVLHSISDAEGKRDLLARIRQVRQREAVYARLAQLKKILAGDKQNASAGQQLVELLMTDLDRPAEARKYSFLADEQTQRIVRLAATNKPTASEAFDLAEWYAGQYHRADDQHTQAAMARRAAQYYRQYQDLHDVHDLSWSKADILAKRFEGYEKAGTPPPGTDRDRSEWVSLLLSANPAKNAIRGKWAYADGFLSGSAAESALIEIPVEPRGDYEIECEVKVASLQQRAVFVLSCSSRPFVLIAGDQKLSLLGAEAKPTALDFDRASDGDTWRRFTIRIEARRRAHRVDIHVDGTRVGRFVIDRSSEITTPAMWMLDNHRHIGVGVRTGAIQVRDIRIRMLDGEFVFSK